MRYAKMLADKIDAHNANAWLLNTGWVGAGAATGGTRCKLAYTRAILDAIHSGELAKVEYETYDVFNLHVPKTCSNVPNEILNPKKSWTGTADFKDEVTKLAELFNVSAFPSLLIPLGDGTLLTWKCTGKLQEIRRRSDGRGHQGWPECLKKK